MGVRLKELRKIQHRLDMLAKLPKIKVDPHNPEHQKTTPAAKLYKELLQQYTNIMKVLIRASGKEDAEEDSPLRIWARGHAGK